MAGMTFLKPLPHGTELATNPLLMINHRHFRRFPYVKSLQFPPKVNRYRRLALLQLSQSPAADIQTDIAATAAVSARNILGPSDTAIAAG